MRAVVTGAAGFIGSQICERLIKEKFLVTGLDCFTGYYPKKTKQNNLRALHKEKNFTFLEANILKVDLKKMLANTDYIFHFAAQTGVRSSWGRDFKSYADNNILGVQRLLEAVKENGRLKKIIFASSSSVYGDAKDLPVKEITAASPVSPYGVTKLAAEKLFYLYGKSHNIPYIILRFFTVYGPRQRPDMAFNIFISKMLAGEKLPVFAGGKSTRDFTYVEDIINCCLLAAKSSHTGEVFNAGGGNRINLLEVIKKLEKFTGKKAKLNLARAQLGDVKDTWADISKAKRLLGYKPVFEIDFGLKKEVVWLIKERGKTI